VSDDLVKWLREVAVEMRVVGMARCAEAADRIEALEAALGHIYAWYPISVTQPRQTIDDIREFARAAMEKKDEQ
jgi:hypothetical protein